MHGVWPAKDFRFYFITVQQHLKNTEQVMGNHDYARNISLVCLTWVSKEVEWSGERGRQRGRCWELSAGTWQWGWTGEAGFVRYVEWQDLRTNYVQGRLWWLRSLGAYIACGIIHSMNWKKGKIVNGNWWAQFCICYNEAFENMLSYWWWVMYGSGTWEWKLRER